GRLDTAETAINLITGRLDDAEASISAETLRAVSRENDIENESRTGLTALLERVQLLEVGAPASYEALVQAITAEVARATSAEQALASQINQPVSYARLDRTVQYMAVETGTYTSPTTAAEINSAARRHLTQGVQDALATLANSAEASMPEGFGLSGKATLHDGILFLSGVVDTSSDGLEFMRSQGFVIEINNFSPGIGDNGPHVINISVTLGGVRADMPGLIDGDNVVFESGNSYEIVGISRFAQDTVGRYSLKVTGNVGDFQNDVNQFDSCVVMGSILNTPFVPPVARDNFVEKVSDSFGNTAERTYLFLLDNDEDPVVATNARVDILDLEAFLLFTQSRFSTSANRIGASAITALTDDVSAQSFGQGFRFNGLAPLDDWSQPTPLPFITYAAYQCVEISGVRSYTNATITSHYPVRKGYLSAGGSLIGVDLDVDTVDLKARIELIAFSMNKYAAGETTAVDVLNVFNPVSGSAVSFDLDAISIKDTAQEKVLPLVNGWVEIVLNGESTAVFIQVQADADGERAVVQHVGSRVMDMPVGYELVGAERRIDDIPGVAGYRILTGILDTRLISLVRANSASTRAEAALPLLREQAGMLSEMRVADLRIAGADGVLGLVSPASAQIANTLDGLADVTLNGVAVGQVLSYNGQVWTNANAANISDIEDLSDVLLNNPQADDALIYDGTRWVNRKVSVSILADVDNAQNAGDGQVLAFSDATSSWVPTTIQEGARSLAQLSDVSDLVTNAEDGQVLAFSVASGEWAPADVAAGVQNLSDLGDVRTSGANAPGPGALLRWSTEAGGAWEPDSLSELYPKGIKQGTLQASGADNLTFEPSALVSTFTYTQQGNQIVVTKSNISPVFPEGNNDFGGGSVFMPATDLGSSDNPFGSVFVTDLHTSANSLFIGDLKLSTPAGSLLMTREGGSPEAVASTDYVDSAVTGVAEDVSELTERVSAIEPGGDVGVVLAASATGVADTPLRATYTATTPPVYAVSGAVIPFTSKSSSTSTLVLNRPHSFTVTNAGEVSGSWVAGVPNDGDAFTVSTTTFDPAPGYIIQIGVYKQYTARSFALKYAADPNDTVSAVTSALELGTLWLTDPLAENSTYSFWYVQADNAWYYSANGFPAAVPVISAATVEPAYAPGSELPNGAIMPIVNLGSPTNRFGTLYLRGNTIDLGGTQLSTNEDGQLVVSTEEGGGAEPYATEAYVDAAVQLLGEQDAALSGSIESINSDIADIEQRISGITSTATASGNEGQVQIAGPLVSGGSTRTFSSFPLSGSIEASPSRLSLEPSTTDFTGQIDLGSATKRYKDVYSAGALVDTLTLQGGVLSRSGSRLAFMDQEIYSTTETNAQISSAVSDLLPTISGLNAVVAEHTNDISALETSVANILSNTNPAALDSLTEVVAAFQAADATLNGAITTLSTGLVSRITGITGVQGESYGSHADDPLLSGAESLDEADLLLSAAVRSKQDAFTLGAGLTLSAGELNTNFNIGDYATTEYVNNAVLGVDLTGVLTTESTLSSAKLDENSVTLAGIEVSLGESVDASTLRGAIGAAGEFTVEGPLQLADAILTFVNPGYATAESVTLQLSEKLDTETFAAFTMSYAADLSQTASSIEALEDALDLKLSVTAFDSYTANTLTAGLAGKVSTATFAAYTLSNNTRVTAVELSAANLATDLDVLSSDLVDEISARSSGDSALQAAIDAKVSFTDELARGAIDVSSSASDGSSLAYNESTGVISYSGAVAGTNITISGGSISLADIVSGLVVSGHILETFDHGLVTSVHSSATDFGSVSSDIAFQSVDLGGLSTGSIF
ncbi:MAG: hypothetical protein ACO32I_03505, partial [Candidatus Limnocylindrus sp.]